MWVLFLVGSVQKSIEEKITVRTGGTHSCEAKKKEPGADNQREEKEG